MYISKKNKGGLNINELKKYRKKAVKKPWPNTTNKRIEPQNGGCGILVPGV